MKNIQKKQEAINEPALGEVKFKDAFWVWLQIGLLSFGGPAGQIALMHRIIVEEKKWISEDRFLHALNYCMLLPGPEAQQLAIYLGWLLHRTLGGIVAGILFVLPAALVILGLSILYASYQDLSFVTAIFYGIKAAVLAVVIIAAIRISQKILGDAFKYVIALGSFLALYIFSVPFPLVILCAALIGLSKNLLFNRAKEEGNQQHPNQSDVAVISPQNTKPSLKRAMKVTCSCLFLWFSPLIILAILLNQETVFLELGLFFSKMAVVTFGGAYAVLAYVAQQAVNVFGWLSPAEMLDGLGLAETTPGPLIMVVQFVGFMGAFRDPGSLDPILAGSLGALVTTWVTFVPCFMWIFLGAPYIEALKNNKLLNAALSMITAAIVGVIINLTIWFSSHVLFSEQNSISVLGIKVQVPILSSIDPIILGITFLSLIAMLLWKVNMITTIVIGTMIGALCFYL